MFKLLVLLVIILGIVAVLQLARVYELTATLRKKREEDISYADNRLNAFLMIAFMVAFYISFIVLMVKYGDYLPPAASEHGASVDTLMNINLAIIITVFFLVNTLLFYFAFKYYYRKDRKAKFFPHDNRLELIWTVIPSIVLAFIIIYGLATWNDITDEASEDAVTVEVYSKQFDWTARYSGSNGQFGASDFNLISGTNPLGIITEQTIGEKMQELNEDLAETREELEAERAFLPDSKIEAMEDKIERIIRHKNRIIELEKYDINGLNSWQAGTDDRIAKGEFHIPVNKEIEFIFRSRDVIHSAYMPHFRAQMNTVPGVPTRFKMTPTITTDSMRMIMDNPEFDYVLLCNKVCGAAHFNMQIKVVVESEEKYEQWLAEQKTFVAEEKEEEETPEDSPASEETIEDETETISSETADQSASL